ncbi:hypothetical protein GGD38_000341 [Chitinophagaceae bacterium OAS944]|nr:hypothetical protein [Chitinophagaceae bacterium OAS944]
MKDINKHIYKLSEHDQKYYRENGLHEDFMEFDKEIK